MDGAVLLIISLIGGGISAAIANSKGRNPIGWFFFGFLAPLIAIIVALVVSDLKEIERQRSHARTERRRLRAQLSQERMKNESFRRHTAGRLDSHDRMLGTDTRQGAPQLGGIRPLAPTLGGGAGGPPPPPPTAATWWYIEGGAELGPVGEAELRTLIANRQVSAEALVWREGLTEWEAASNFPQLVS